MGPQPGTASPGAATWPQPQSGTASKKRKDPPSFGAATQSWSYKGSGAPKRAKAAPGSASDAEAGAPPSPPRPTPTPTPEASSGATGKGPCDDTPEGSPGERAKTPEGPLEGEHAKTTTLRQAEHAAAEVALSRLSLRGPSTSLTARVLDETGVYKNLLQETAHRTGLKLPAYTTVRSGPGHSPVFASTVELAGLCFAGDPARTKKQAEKNAAMAAWSSLKQMPEACKEPGACCGGEEQEQVVVARVPSALKLRGACSDGKAAPPSLKQCTAGSSSSSAPNALLYRHQWRPLTSPAQPMTRHVQPQPAGPKILPPMHLLQRAAACTSRDGAAAQLEQARRINASELVQMLERAMVRDRAEPMPSSCYYGGHASAYHHGGAPRSFAAGGFHSPAMAVAPAVSVRSVIPVCSAPPSPPQPAAKEDDDRMGPAAAP